MKAICFAVLIMLVLKLNAEQTYKFSEALQKGLVSIKINGAKPDSLQETVSGHYGPCMQMEIVSLNSLAMSLNLDYGYSLVPHDSSLQTMIVTQSLIVKVLPKQKKLQKIYAMCTEASDAGPSFTKNFNLGFRSIGSLLDLTKLINQRKYQTDAAQNAVWCLTDNHDISSIYSSDTAMMYELRRFVATAKGVALSKIYEAGNSYTLQATYVTRTVYSGSLSYSLSRPTKIMVALFDENNHMKTVYVNNETQKQGEYTYNYKIGSDEMNSQKHYLRLFRDAKLEEEISIIPRE